MKHFLILCIFSIYANAETVTWTAPTKNTDGTTIPSCVSAVCPPDSLASYKIQWGTCNGTAFGIKAGEQNLPLTPPTVSITGLAPGLTCFQMFAINTSGVSSDPTNAASKLIVPVTPNPPTIITIAVVAGVNVVPVFGLSSTGVRSSTVIGFAPLGITCLGDPLAATYRGQKYYHVNPADVIFWATPSTPNAVAACG